MDMQCLCNVPLIAASLCALNLRHVASDSLMPQAALLLTFVGKNAGVRLKINIKSPLITFAYLLRHKKQQIHLQLSKP